MFFLSKTEEELSESLGNLMENEAKDKVIDEVNKCSRDEEVIQIYTKLIKEEMEKNTFIEEARNEELKRGIEEVIQKGLKQGILEGKNERNIEIAKLLLNKNNMTLDEISEITGLSIEELNNLN